MVPQDCATPPALDEERRAKLKLFLVEARSRLKPRDVGLPSTARRRVTGLRREEIAELVGISSDWYRWFESGRQIRVSVGFLTKLAEALRLDPMERITLFYLALPEMYEAAAKASAGACAPAISIPSSWFRLYALNTA